MERRGSIRPGILLGIGLGGFVDGIVLHQILQWHHMVSGDVPMGSLGGLEDNTLADGIFHLTFLIVLLIGIGLLVGRRIERRPFIGMLLVGWGLFHILDQLVFHLALGAHHIRQGAENYALYDWGFFAIGLLLVAGGAAIAAGRGTARPEQALAPGHRR